MVELAMDESVRRILEQVDNPNGVAKVKIRRVARDDAEPGVFAPTAALGLATRVR